MSSKKNVFLWGRSGDAKVVFFLAGSFSRNREVFKGDGLIRRFFFFLDIQMLMRKSDVFEVGPDTKIYEEQSSCPFFDV